MIEKPNLNQRPRYSQLLNNGERPRRKNPGSSSNGMFHDLGKIILYTLAILGFTAIVKDLYAAISSISSHSDNLPVSCSCGETVSEAISNGCRYDLLAAAWLPEHCRDDELSAEFDRSGPGPNGEWTYYADEEGNRVLNASDVGRLSDFPGSLYYTTLEWHSVHCYFYWIKQWRATRMGIAVEKRYDNEEHIRHCAKVLMTRDAKFGEVMTSQGASLQSGEEKIIEPDTRPALHRR